MTRTRPLKNQIAGAAADRVYSAKKQKYFTEATRLLGVFDKALVVRCDNVQSFQMQQVRIALRGTAVVLMGKNTQLRKVLKDRAAAGTDRDRIMYEKIVAGNLLKGNVGLILTNGNLDEVKKAVDANKIQAPARQGAIAPLDVVVPAGNTGLEPTKTSFFQALNIGTKITKGTVEILKDEKVVNKGEKVGSSEATLLQMLGIKPFFYGLEILHIYDQGSVYGPEILALTDEDMKKKFTGGVSNVTALSLALGFTTKASLPHVMVNAFKNLLALSVLSDYTFSACNGEALKEAIVSGKGLGGGSASAAAPAAAAPAAAEKAAPAKKEEEEAEEEDMGFGLFD